MAAPEINDVQMEPDPSSVSRFQIELEFVQCLANPKYLNYLAQHNYFKEDEFVNYLKYLQYWKEPTYAKFIKYPHCLYMLDLLQQKSFRDELINVPCSTFIEDQQLKHWASHFKRRMGIINNCAVKKVENNVNVKEERDQGVS